LEIYPIVVLITTPHSLEIHSNSCLNYNTTFLGNTFQ
jgi:hypothetical protein